MYLLDTNIISELRKRDRANPGIIRFFRQIAEQEEISYLSVITIGELRRGVDIIQHRGDVTQAKSLEIWLETILDRYVEHILDFGREEAQIWGRLRVPHPENALDKQIAATALVYDLTLVTRNVKDFAATGVTLLNPFE
jgi:toxin FitB